MDSPVVPSQFSSAVIEAPVPAVFDAIKSMNFKWLSTVSQTHTESTHTKDDGLVSIVYTDNTIQRIRQIEFSQIERKVSWEVIDSEPAAPTFSAVHTITCTPITTSNTTFVAWSTDFSSDCTTEVLEDNKWKKIDAFSQLNEFCRGGTSAGIGSIASCVGSRPMVCGLRIVTKEEVDVAQRFKASRGDIFISTYPKTGTTYLQQVCHQLRTGGHVDFDEISEEGLVPWLEVSPSLRINLDLPQTASPRCFKTHQMLSSLAHLEVGGGKFLCTVRDPAKTLVSQFKFLLSHDHPAVTSLSPCDINLFIKSAYVLGAGGEGELRPTFGGTLWDFYSETWRCRENRNVKILVFEQIVSDLEAHLDGINSFLGLAPLSTTRKGQVLEYCHKDWMERNDHQFDDHHMAVRLAAKKGKAAGKGYNAEPGPGHATVKKVGLEVSGDVIAELNAESKVILADMWKKHMQPVTGHGSYSEMVKDLV